MTRLGRAFALIAVFAAGYAILMLVNGQPTDFEVSAGVCAAGLLGATLSEYVVRLSRKALAHGRAAVWERVATGKRRRWGLTYLLARPTGAPRGRPSDRRAARVRCQAGGPRSPAEEVRGSPCLSLKHSGRD